MGLFPRARWLELLADQGFAASAVGRAVTDPAAGGGVAFLGRRPAE
jgi:hypothetical protein